MARQRQATPLNHAQDQESVFVTQDAHQRRLLGDAGLDRATASGADEEEHTKQGHRQEDHGAGQCRGADDLGRHVERWGVGRKFLGEVDDVVALAAFDDLIGGVDHHVDGLAARTHGVEQVNLDLLLFFGVGRCEDGTDQLGA